MGNSLKSRLAKQIVAGAAAAAMAASAGGEANAAVVYWNYKRHLGATIDGLYVNVEFAECQSIYEINSNIVF